MSKTKTIVPASIQFVDIAGLVEGASQGEGLGTRFLSHIREVDAIVYVLRAFVNDDVPGSHDPLEQLQILETELTLADLDSVERLAEKRRKAARVDKSIADEVAAMDAALVHLANGTPIYRSDLSEAQLVALKGFALLTSKPVVALVNLDEEQLEAQLSAEASSRSTGEDEGQSVGGRIAVEPLKPAAMNLNSAMSKLMTSATSTTRSPPLCPPATGAFASLMLSPY